MFSLKRSLLSVMAGMLLVSFSTITHAENPPAIPTNKPWSERMALSVMQRSPEAWQMRGYRNLSSPEWGYTYALSLAGFQKLYEKTGNEDYLDYVKVYVDQLIDKDGKLKHYEISEFNIDSVNGGKLLFALHEKTGDDRYLKVMQQLRHQLQWQPRTTEGGFWHKRIYPYQMWLDGLYMGATYYAQYAARFNEGAESFDDIANQFILIEKKTRDAKTGLLYHAWDESKLQAWADNETGLSPHFWSRALGWYAMALVDTLDYFPENHKDRQTLIDILNRLAEAVARYQDKTGLWYQVTDMGDRFGNYLEASGSGMFVYAFAKGANKGYLPVKYKKLAEKGFDGMVKHFVVLSPNKEVTLTHICGSAGLGGSPYRSGSFDYYISEALRDNDPHGVGPFILASLELNR